MTRAAAELAYRRNLSARSLVTGRHGLVGLVVSVFQAATQINEQTLSFLPRLLTTLITVMVAGPWLLARLIEFTRRITDTFALVLS